MSNEAKRVAIVTGASRGIGAEVARRLAADGFAVVVNYRVGEDAARGVVAEIETSGGRAVAVQADVSIPDEVRRMFDTAERAFRGVDVLVNNAGLRPNVTIADMDDATWGGAGGSRPRGAGSEWPPVRCPLDTGVTRVVTAVAGRQCARARR